MAYGRTRGRYNPAAAERREREERAAIQAEKARARMARLLRQYKQIKVTGEEASRAWGGRALRTYYLGGENQTIIRQADGVLYLQSAGPVGWNFHRLVPRYQTLRREESDVERDRADRAFRRMERLERAYSAAVRKMTGSAKQKQIGLSWALKKKTARDHATHRFTASERSGRAASFLKLAKKGGSHTYAEPAVKRTASYKRAERLEEELAPKRWNTPGLSRSQYEKLADAWERAGFLGWADNYRAHVEQHRIGRDRAAKTRSRRPAKRRARRRA